MVKNIEKILEVKKLSKLRYIKLYAGIHGPKLDVSSLDIHLPKIDAGLDIKSQKLIFMELY